MIQLYRNFSQVASLQSAYKKDGRNLVPGDLSIITDATIVFDDAEILWVGKDSDLPSKYSGVEKDFSGHTLLPEIVDSHTHLIFGGDRATEYASRLNGADYEEIARQGGGILSTMNGTNSLSSEQLFELCCERIERINSYGIGTIEIKSGYGLNYEKELELSQLIHRLKKHFYPRIQISNTFMAAHAVPKSFSTSDAYLEQVVLPLLEDLHSFNIIDSVDIFHEKGYFTSDDVHKLFSLAKKLNIPTKSHADEFYDNGGAILAASYDSLSTDHLLSTGSEGISSLAKSNTVATLLPGTGLFLGKPQANGRAFLDQGCKVAIASDYNPGSCHCDNLILLASIAAPIYKMNLSELIAAITLNAAHALNMRNQGAIIEGLKPRFSVFTVNTVDKITYNWGRNFSINKV